jgi:hypothetical protein
MVVRVVSIAIIFAWTVLAQLPQEFDSTTQWPNCDWTIYNQGSCGSCYTFSTSETVTSRMCTAGVWADTQPSVSTNTVGISPTNLLDCPGSFMAEPVSKWFILFLSKFPFMESLIYSQTLAKVDTSAKVSNHMQLRLLWVGAVRQMLLATLVACLIKWGGATHLPIIISQDPA